MVLGKDALETQTLFLKNEYKDIELVSEQRSMITSITQSSKAALKAISTYFAKGYGTDTNKTQNASKLLSAGFEVDKNIVGHFASGKTSTIDDMNSAKLNDKEVIEVLDTHKHGREYHNRIGKIGLEINMEYSYMSTIIRKLFDKTFNYSGKVLSLEPREVYAFVINNTDKLRCVAREAMAMPFEQMEIKGQTVSKSIFRIPQSCLFTFDSTAKTQLVMNKNAYQNYLSSAEPHSSSERKFEKFCERSNSVEWLYKNGKKGNKYLSIVYQDNGEKQKNFYPDYIIGVNGEIWIVETKGGFDRTGNSQDIDIYTEKSSTC